MKAPDVTDKWGPEIAGRGFSQTPNYLLYINQFIDESQRLSPLELMVLVQLVSVWWRKAEYPFPSVKTLSIRCGSSERQILRAISRLEALKLLKRAKRREGGFIASNVYDLSPLVDRLAEVAKAYPNAFPRGAS